METRSAGTRAGPVRRRRRRACFARRARGVVVAIAVGLVGAGCGEAPDRFEFGGYAIEPPPQWEFREIGGLQPAADLAIGNPFIDVYIVAFVEPKVAGAETEDLGSPPDGTPEESASTDPSTSEESDVGLDRTPSPSPVGNLDDYTARAIRYWTGDAAARGSWRLADDRGARPGRVADRSMMSSEFEILGRLRENGDEIRARVTCIDTNRSDPVAGDFVQIVAWSPAESFPDLAGAIGNPVNGFRRSDPPAEK